MTKKEVIAKAKEFCKENNVNDYPVEIVSLCNKFGLKVYEKYLPSDVSGSIVVGSDKFDRYNSGNFIMINLMDSPQRRRFTIAHELAHFILHKEPGQALYAHRDAGQHDQTEVEANIFASYVLMPDELIKDALDRLEDHRHLPLSVKVGYISREFAVSRDAAQVRLAQFGITS